jgi:hypothetical protein
MGSGLGALVGERPLHRLRSAWPFVLAVFAFSRIFFLGVGAVATTTLPWAEPSHDAPFDLPAPPLSYWAHWDGVWYWQIAYGGYDVGRSDLTGFFPLFPMLVHLATAVGGELALWGVAISLAATLFALYFLYRITERLWDVTAARAATLSFAFFPTAFFLNAFYTEALFVAFAAGSYWAAFVKRDLLLAGILGALASATRNIGVLLLVPLGYEWIRNRREFGSRGVGELALVPLGLLGYMVFLQGRFGNPLIFAHAQTLYWDRDLTNPLDTLNAAWIDAGVGLRYVLDPASLFLDPAALPALEASGVVNIVFLALAAFLVGVGFAVLPLGLSLFAFVVTLMHLLTPNVELPLLGLPRFILVIFPLFLVLGYLLSRSRPALYFWLVLSSSLGAALTAMFVTWRWVA